MNEGFKARDGLLVLFASASLLCASQAHAFSDQDRFAESSVQGGGGGRYFTGSPSDGFGCSVCHRGASAPKVGIRGLPDDFLAGTTYDVELEWDESARAHALTLEFVTAQGSAAGTIALQEDTEISLQERCKGQATEPLAAELKSVEGRQVLVMRACGASLVRFRWTAPQASEITFAAGIVRSDASATPEGDGVVELSHTLLPVGAKPPSDASGCDVMPRASTASTSAMVVGLTLLLLVTRTRRRHSSV